MRLVSTQYRARYAEPGFLLFVRERSLIAQAFNPATLELESEAVPVVEPVGLDRGRASPSFTVSDNGGLAYRIATLDTQLMWVDRETTPFVKSLLPELLVAENHLPNNEATAGSIAALLSGKLPTATRVFYPEDAFLGDDVFQHLPGLLRSWGYTNADIGLRFFADAHDMNMRQAFHVGVGRRLETLGPLEWLRPRLTSEAYFLDLLQERIGNRLRYAFGLQDVADPYQAPWNPETDSDANRMAELRGFLEEARRPFFAHVHLMGTHGDRFYPTLRHFSAGSEQTEPWMRDFSDDAILQFDAYVAEALQFLKDIGDYEDTLIIINSDHGSQWTIDRRLPLLVRFPHQEHRGRLTWNLQRIDIAPTIVDFLGGHIPAWMTGRSLIGREPNPRRPIFSFLSTDSDRSREGPPFYNLRAVQVALGDRLYRLDLHTGESRTWRIDGHTAPLEPWELPSMVEVEQTIIQQLTNSGYDESSHRSLAEGIYGNN